MPHTGPSPRATAATALAALALLATGCQDAARDDDPGPASRGDDPAWTTSTDPVTTGGPVWASDGVVHLSDGTTVDVGGPLTTYVVAGDGVYFTPAESAEAGVQHSSTTTAPLHFADRDGEVTDTGLTVYAESLGSSPDGRYLGLVDATSGEGDEFTGTSVATAVVVDLSTGDRVVETTDGMGDPDEDDLEHDYPETNLGVRFPDSDSAYVEGLDEDRLYALPGGEGEVVDPIDSPVHDPLDRTNQDRTWTIDTGRGRTLLVSADGEQVEPRFEGRQVGVGWWLDPGTVLGESTGRPVGVLVTCTVPRGECRPVEGTEGVAVRLPVDTSANDAVDLRGGAA